MKEYFLSCWQLILLSFGMGVAVAPAARAADVTFNVNLHYQAQQGRFTLGTDAASVVVGGTTVALTRSGADGNVYTGTLTGQTAAAQLTYSYRFTHGGSTTNETSPTRRYVVQSYSSANVLDDWFNDQQPPNYPYADFYASSVKVIPGEIVRFNDSSQGGSGTLTWAFAGGSPATGAGSSPTTTWTSPGTYAVTLTASNAGVTTTKTISITVVDPAQASQVLGWWNDAVFYQLYPRSFFDTGGITDSRNGGGIGDFQGMMQKLDYLNDGNPGTTTDLGVTALYIMPIHDATNPGFGGYEVIDYKSVIAELGSKTDFDNFVAAAHQRGMKVILDMVFNHTSLQNQWFQQGMTGNGQYSNYYVHRPTQPGSPPWFSNPLNPGDASYKYYYGWFGQNTPELDFNTSSVRNTIKDVSKYWLDQKVDGFRLDAPMFLYEKGNALSYEEEENLPATYTYWRSWRKYLKDNPGTQQANPFSVGETWLPNRNDIPTAARYVYQGFDIGFQFDVAYGVQNALNNGYKRDLQDKVDSAMRYYPFLQFGVMLSNHDMSANGDGGNPRRFKDRLTDGANKYAKLKVAATFLLTTPGVPFVYFGDEIGAGGDDWARSPMRWTPGTNAGFTTASRPWENIASEFTTYNVQTQDATDNSILRLYRTLVRTRLASTALRQGKYTTVSNPSAAVYTFVRTAGAETVFVVLNMSAQAQSNVALSVALPNGVPNGTYTLTNLLDQSQPAATSVTVTNGSISSWTPFSTLAANAYYVLRLNNTSSGPNAAPTLAAIADQTLNLEDGAKAVALTNVTDGDYCSQTLTGSATRANATVLSAATVSNVSCGATTATLTLTPAAVGSSSVTVTLTDNGGTANGGVNTTSRSFTATITDVPRAPINLTLSQASPTSVSVGWTDNSGRETGYRVYWSTGSTKPATANATVAANATSYTATGLSTQTTYNFWVEAYNGNGASAPATGTFTLTLPNLALNKPANASNVETYQGVTYSAALAVDGLDNSFTNRWSAPVVSSAGNDQKEWIRVDLGATYNLSRVVISWEDASADAYYIMASNSDVTPDPASSAWSKLNVTGQVNQSRKDDKLVSFTGRYLAIYCYHKSQPYGYSIYELQAYGLAATGNQAPSASAGPNQTLPYTVTSTPLDASGSTDPEGSALTYTWSQTSGPTSATFSSKAVAKPTVSGLAVGSYGFQVSVSDGALSSTAQVTVTVQANQAPVASAGPNQSLAAGTTSTTLTAAGSADPEGKPLTYSWTKVSGAAVTFSSTSAASPTVSGLAAGSYVFQVSVSDGALSSTAQVTVTVASSGTTTSYYIVNRWKGTYLADNGSSQVSYVAATTSNSARWTLETVGSYERIRNVASGNYMNVENLGANVQCTNVPNSFTSSQWAREAVSGTSYYRIRNNWQSGAYVHVENQTGFAQYGSVDVSYYSGHWTFQSTAGARPAASPLATTTAATAESLAVYPNPVTAGRLMVRVPGVAATARVRLFDAQGRLVFSQEAALTNGQVELDVARCSAGLYLLQAEADGMLYAQKLLVQ